MFRSAARAGTYSAPASAHDATTEYSTRLMRIAISYLSCGLRTTVHLGVVSRRAMVCQAVGTAHYRALQDNIALGEAWKAHRSSIGWCCLRCLAFASRWTG